MTLSPYNTGFAQRASSMVQGAFSRLRGMTGFDMGDAARDLGLGGLLGDQVANESAEARKKRMQQIQERALMGPGGTLSTYSLFGGSSGGGGGSSYA